MSTFFGAFTRVGLLSQVKRAKCAKKFFDPGYFGPELLHKYLSSGKYFGLFTSNTWSRYLNCMAKLSLLVEVFKLEHCEINKLPSTLSVPSNNLTQPKDTLILVYLSWFRIRTYNSFHFKHVFIKSKSHTYTSKFFIFDPNKRQFSILQGNIRKGPFKLSQFFQHDFFGFITSWKTLVDQESKQPYK